MPENHLNRMLGSAFGDQALPQLAGGADPTQLENGGLSDAEIRPSRNLRA